MKFYACILFCVFCISANCQTITPEQTFLRFRSVNSKIIKKDSRGEFESNGEWIKNSILITVDLKNLKVTLYADSPQDYSIYEISKTEIDNNNVKWIVLKGVRKDGTPVSIRLAGYTDMQREKDYHYLFSLYFDYKEITIVHRVNIE